MTRRGGKCAISSSVSAGGYSPPHTPNPSWRRRPAEVESDIAAEICVTEIEGNWLRLRWLTAERALPYREVA